MSPPAGLMRSTRFFPTGPSTASTIVPGSPARSALSGLNRRPGKPSSGNHSVLIQRAGPRSPATSTRASKATASGSRKSIAQLGLAFRYGWSTAETHGLVRRCELENLENRPVPVRVLDGLRNLLPPGIPYRLQVESSCLVDAYKTAELLPGTVPGGLCAGGGHRGPRDPHGIPAGQHRLVRRTAGGRRAPFRRPTGRVLRGAPSPPLKHTGAACVPFTRSVPCSGSRQARRSDG